MGVGYSASALHLISYLDTENSPSTPGPAGPQIAGVKYYRFAQAKFRSPAAADIVAWRDRLGAKYRGQLGESLSWDEASDFSRSEDVGTTDDMLLRYVAAVVDETGTPLSLHGLVGVTEPPRADLQRAFDGAERRGFTGRFPQLLLGPTCRLPYQRHLIIEEPDWRGNIQRFGSVYRLADEMRELRPMIMAADPRCADWTPRRVDPMSALEAARQVSDTIERLCGIATSRRLPFWSTG